MPRINLLPWREEDRKRRQREFGIATAGAVVVAVGAVLLTMFAYSRMVIIEQLQKSRPEVVHLFDEVARQLPEGVYLTGLKQTGARVEIRGIAQSSTRVSALMRQVDASEWMSDPEVERVETTQSGASRQAEFVVYVKQTSAGDDTEELQ